jgi:hypothetical protein
MVTIDLAVRLHDAGLRWTPAAGDRFSVPGREMDEDVFVLSDMTIDVHESRTWTVIGFNGTTEWALDSLEQQDAVWLPSETQLRERLQRTFVRLERDGATHRVVISVSGREVALEHEDPAQAYGLALLYLITGEHAAA